MGNGKIIFATQFLLSPPKLNVIPLTPVKCWAGKNKISLCSKFSLTSEKRKRKIKSFLKNLRAY